MRIMLLSLVAVLVFTARDIAEDLPVDSSPEFDGVTEAYRIVSLSAAVDGVLETVTVDRGDAVRKGAVVATLESSVERATLEIAKARAENRADLEAQEARLDYSLSKLAHDKDLHERGLVSAEKLDLSKKDMLLAKAGVRKAEENTRLAVLERERAKAALELRTIRSPVDGVVTERLLLPGELVTRLSSSKILTIAQISPLRVEVILPSSLFGTVTVGMEAEVRPDILIDTAFTAQVKTVDPVIDAASGSFRIRLEMLNPENRLPAGLKCRVRLVE